MLFDRVDYQFTQADSVHLNLNYSRSWFQTPNAYDNLNVSNVVSGGAGPDPSSPTSETPIRSPRLKPSISRRPIPASSGRIRCSTSAPMFAAMPTTTIPAAIPWPTSVRRTCKPPRSHNIEHLPMPGCARISPTKRECNNIKVGAVYQQTFLRENDSLGRRRSHLQLPLRRQQRQSAAGLFRSHAMRCGRIGIE